MGEPVGAGALDVELPPALELLPEAEPESLPPPHAVRARAAAVAVAATSTPRRRSTRRREASPFRSCMTAMGVGNVIHFSCSIGSSAVTQVAGEYSYTLTAV